MGMDEAILFLVKAIPYKYNLNPYYTLFHFYSIIW